MSKRSEEAALKALPNYPPETYADEDEYIEVESERSMQRAFYQKGYEQAEKDTIERACEWMEKNLRFPHPRKGTEECIVNLWAFREAMEESE